MLQRNGQSGEQLTLKRRFLLQLILLNEATLVLVNDCEGLLEVIGGLASQADLCEEALVVERVSSCGETEKGGGGAFRRTGMCLVESPAPIH